MKITRAIQCLPGKPPKLHPSLVSQVEDLVEMLHSSVGGRTEIAWWPYRMDGKAYWTFEVKSEGGNSSRLTFVEAGRVRLTEDDHNTAMELADSVDAHHLLTYLEQAISKPRFTHSSMQVVRAAPQLVIQG